MHYEVLINKKKVNSQKLKLPSGKILKGEARKEFEISRIKIDLKLSELKVVLINYFSSILFLISKFCRNISLIYLPDWF